ncbi:PQQ-dependent sugar dehydrogenase [Sphingomonas cannabina]|uniref:PQQ-dependent sugar dehydrogenase n=1 Tax=Sphingomonas cannabina TaxID=2899123 RepID=UPI001F3938F3|nr:PQQ-dependent sugar dehydrogenase [Sphingomonas cannabina]UIJ45625.1 PQQ-dependent sugar dehydrogenase [Sphingomonas cannabina]
MKRWTTVLILAALAGCDGGDGGSSPTPSPTPTATPTPTPSPSPSPTPSPSPSPITSVNRQVVATFDAPWAMVFLPDGRMLVTEKPGRLQLATQGGAKTEVSGVPAVYYGGQLGFQDVILDPDYANNRRIYLSYAESASGGQRLAVARATLNLDGTPRLDGLSVIWRAVPTTTGGQLGARLAFSPDGRYLFVATGERQQGSPAQDMGGTLGKIVRLNPDGSVAAGNPFASTTGARPEIWTLGHRNPYGLAFDASERLWEHEMGPKGGDELNLIEPGKNYGWPNVSNGSNYDGTPIPDHAPGDGYAAPAISWNPVISPAGLIFYSGNLFADWHGDAILGGLSSQGLVRVRISGTAGTEMQRIPLGNRIREVEQGPDGAIWVLEDAPTGRLLKLTPGS